LFEHALIVTHTEKKNAQDLQYVTITDIIFTSLLEMHAFKFVHPYS